MIQEKDHWDKSRTCALLESKPLNPRKTNEFLLPNLTTSLRKSF